MHTVLLSVLCCAGLAAQEAPAGLPAALQKKVEACSKSISERFVFLRTCRSIPPG